MVAVKYKYPNEAEVIINQANDYTLSFSEQPIYWQPVLRYYSNYRERIMININAQLVKTKPNTMALKQNGEALPTNYFPTQQPLLHPAWAMTSGEKNGAGNNIYLWTNSTRNDSITLSSILSAMSAKQGLQRTTVNTSSGFKNVWVLPFDGLNYKGLSSLETSEIEIVAYHGVTQNPFYVTLKIFNGTNEVFSRTEGYSPDYVEIIFDKQCPNNTCPVKCDDLVCCYGSEGIATESFLFSESIYQS